MSGCRAVLRRGFALAALLLVPIICHAVPIESSGLEILLPYLDEQLRTPRYFGVYAQGRKVGYVRMARGASAPGELALETRTVFRVQAMGQTSEMDATEVRTFSRQDGALRGLSYDNRAAGHSMRFRARVSGGELVYTQSRGAGRAEGRAPLSGESLGDTFVLERLLLSGAAFPVSGVSTRSFDTELLTTTTATYTRSEIVALSPDPSWPAPLTRFYGQVAPLGLPVSVLYDAKGVQRESSLAGFLVLRAETAEKALSGFSTEDFVFAMRVAVPAPIENADKASGLLAELSGVPVELRLDDARQRFVSMPGGRVKLNVTRETVNLAATPAPAALDTRAEVQNLADDPRFGLKDTAIATTAHAFAASSKTSGELALRLMRFVHDSLTQVYTPAVASAPEVLRQKRGDCGEHAVLFVALARAAGLPAREVAGLVYSPNLEGFGYHAWAEVWLGRWIALDPTFNQFPADPTHLAFAHGSLIEQAKIISLIGHLQILELSLH